jgi:hypothetical protein
MSFAERMSASLPSSERKRKRLHAGIEKLNLKRPIFDGALLPDQLV